jgi:hypothetical protein
LNRDIPAILAAGGLTVTDLKTYYGRAEPKPFGYLYEGRATAS